MDEARLNALFGAQSNFGRRSFDQYVHTLKELGGVATPVVDVLPTVEAIHPFRPPSGIVAEVSADAAIASLLTNRHPLTAVHMLELPNVSSSVAAKLETLAPTLLAKSAGAFTLQAGDSAHWESDLVSGKVTLVRTEHTSPVDISSLFSKPKTDFRHSLVATVEASPALMEEYASIIRRDCVTAGQMVQHSATKRLESSITRATNRMLYQIAEGLDLAVPAAVDRASVFHQSSEFTAPLMAIPTSAQLNNTVAFTADGTRVRLFNNAVDLHQSAGLRRVVIDLGPQLGFAQFETNLAAASLALPVGVRREVTITNSAAATATPTTKLPGVIGLTEDTAALFSSSYYAKPSEELISGCMQRCGSTQVPIIHTPVLTLVGAEFTGH